MFCFFFNEVCNDVEIEPHLNRSKAKQDSLASLLALIMKQEKSDIKADGVWESRFSEICFE